VMLSANVVNMTLRHNALTAAAAAFNS